jgi:hypothetical protein
MLEQGSRAVDDSSRAQATPRSEVLGPASPVTSVCEPQLPLFQCVCVYVCVRYHIWGDKLSLLRHQKTRKATQSHTHASTIVVIFSL